MECEGILSLSMHLCCVERNIYQRRCCVTPRRNHNNNCGNVYAATFTIITLNLIFWCSYAVAIQRDEQYFTKIFIFSV